jgi:hypothetical protein
MTNTLKIATGGYLKRTGIVSLTIAIDGYLGKSIITPIKKPEQVIGSSSDSHWEYEYRINNIQLLDSEIIEIVKITLKHFII